MYFHSICIRHSKNNIQYNIHTSCKIDLSLLCACVRAFLWWHVLLFFWILLSSSSFVIVKPTTQQHENQQKSLSNSTKRRTVVSVLCEKSRGNSTIIIIIYIIQYYLLRGKSDSFFRANSFVVLQWAQPPAVLRKRCHHPSKVDGRPSLDVPTKEWPSFAYCWGFCWRPNWCFGFDSSMSIIPMKGT